MSLNTKPFVRLRDAVGFNVTALRLFFLLQIKISLALAVLVSEVNQTSHFSWNEPKQTTLTLKIDELFVQTPSLCFVLPNPFIPIRYTNFFQFFDFNSTVRIVFFEVTNQTPFDGIGLVSLHVISLIVFLLFLRVSRNSLISLHTTLSNLSDRFFAASVFGEIYPVNGTSLSSYQLVRVFESTRFLALVVPLVIVRVLYFIDFINILIWKAIFQYFISYLPVRRHRLEYY